METYLSSKKIEELLLPEIYQSAFLKIEELKKRLSELREQYPSKETVPPEGIRQELLNSLDILK